MIKKTVITFLIISTLYSIFWILHTPKTIIAQEHWQENQITAQNYLYGNLDSVENLIIGTSLSRALIMDSLPGFFNLSLNGELPFQGLEVMEKKGVYPKRVFIETNRIFSWFNRGLFNEILSNPVLHTLRTPFSIMRDGRQPILTAATSIESIFVDRNIFYTALYDRAILYGGRIDMNNEADVRFTFHEYMEVPNDKQIETTVSLLNHYFEILKRHNTEIIIYEMPISKILLNTPKMRGTRKCMHKHFPPTEYTYLPQPEYLDYKTYDGTHMVRDEAIKYTHLFKTQVDSLIHIGK